MSGGTVTLICWLISFGMMPQTLGIPGLIIGGGFWVIRVILKEN